MSIFFGLNRDWSSDHCLENDDVPVVIGRASDFFGPGVIDTAPLVDPFGAALRGDRVSALGALDEPHSFCYLPDFAAALVTLGNHEQAFGGVWHVPHPLVVTVGEFLTMVFDAAGTDCDVRTAPWFIEALLGVVNADVRELRAINHQFTQPFVVDDSKFTETFDVTPTSLSEAIETTLAWHRSERSDSVAQ